MKKSTKIMAIIAVLFLLVSSASFAQAKSEVPAYLLAILLGFGTGHFYVGDANATLFLIADIACVGGIIAGSIIMFASINPLDPYASVGGVTAGYVVIGVAVIAWTIFHIWQIIDIFRAVDDAKKAGTVASNTFEFNLQPTGFSMRYNF